MARVDIAGRLSPEMQAVIARQAEIVAETGIVWQPGDVGAMRALYDADRAFWNRGGPEMAATVDAVVPGPAGDIPVRIHRPLDDAAAPALVYLHGGGWVVGNLDTHDRIMRQLAHDGGFAVVGVDYRLAPEAKFPAPFEDCFAAVDAIAARAADWRIDGARLAVGGDSAGAHMALAALLRQRDRGDDALKAGLLCYGAYGLRDSRSRRIYGGPEDGLTEDDLAFFLDTLMTDPARQARDPLYNLLAADMAGLPPLFVAAAEIDPLIDDSVALVALLEAAGLDHVYAEYPGVLHGFLHYGRMMAVSRKALADCAAFLNEKLS